MEQWRERRILLPVSSTEGPKGPVMATPAGRLMRADTPLMQAFSKIRKLFPPPTFNFSRLGFFPVPEPEQCHEGGLAG